MASFSGHAPVVELLLQHGADVNKANDYGQTPLHFALKKGHTQVVDMLRNFRAYTPVNANAVISNNSIPLAVNDDNDADVSVADAISIPHAELSYDTDNLPVVNATKMRWGGRKTNKKRKMNKKLKTNKKRKINKKRKTNKKR
jgi:ankyrin repeat protein